MITKNRKIICNLVLFFIFLSVFCCFTGVVSASAQMFGNAEEQVADLAQAAGYGSATLPEIVGRIIEIVLSLIGLAGVIIVIAGGFIWMTSGGDIEKITKAKKLMTSALVGVLIVIMAYAIVSFVLSKLAGITGEPGPVSPPICIGAGCNPIPPDNFAIKKIVTTHEGLYQNNDVYLCSAVIPTFNRYLNSDKIFQLVTGKDIKITKEDGGNEFSGGWETAGNTIVFSHTDNFERNTAYLVYLPKEITSEKNEFLEACNADGGCSLSGNSFVWTFTTGENIDITKPYITSSYPILSSQDGYPDTNIDLRPIIQINFFESINPASIMDENSQLKDNIKLLKITNRGPEELIEPLVSSEYFETTVEDKSVFLKTLKDLEPFVWYRLSVEGVQDLCFNVMDGTITWDFETNDQSPSIKSRNPSGDKVCADTEIKVVFSISMYANEVTIKLKAGEEVITEAAMTPKEMIGGYEKRIPEEPTLPLSGYLKVDDVKDLVGDGFRSFTFTPVADLLEINTTYTVEVTTDLVLDQQGNLLGGKWDFSTKSAGECFCSPFISYLSPRQGGPGQCLTINGSCFIGTENQPAVPSKIKIGGTEVIIGGGDGNYLTTTVPLTGFSVGNRPLVQVFIEYPQQVEEVSSNEQEFVITTIEESTGPCLYSVSPRSGYPNETKVVLKGVRFGIVGDESKIIFYNNIEAVFVDDDWSDGEVKDVITPTGIDDGEVVVKNNIGISNGIKFEVLKHTSGPGGVCQDFDNCIDTPYLCQNPYQCMTDVNCHCCCTPGDKLGKLECLANQGNCTGASRGLFCGCKTDSECGTGSGCGILDANKCCYGRPTIKTITPDGLSNICLNQAFTVTFDQTMDKTRLNKTNINFLKKNITTTEYEEIDYNLIVNNDGSQININPLGCLLEKNSNYKVRLIGGANGEGIRSVYGVSLTDGEADIDEIYEKEFTTGENICGIDSLKVNPETVTVKSAEEEIIYTAIAYDASSQPVCNIDPYSWATSDGTVASFKTDSGLSNSYSGLMSTVISGNKEGENSTIIAATHQNSGKEGTGIFISKIKIVLPQVINDQFCQIATASPSPQPNFTETCPQTIVSARFNSKITEATLDFNNIIIKKCGNGLEFESKKCSGLISGEISTNGFSGQGFKFEPTNLWENKYWYEITLKSGTNGIKGINGKQLDGNKNDAEDDSPIDDYVWHFRATDQSDKCAIKQVKIYESTPIGKIPNLLIHDKAVNPEIAESREYSADVQGPDCQSFAPKHFDWTWSKDPDNTDDDKDIVDIVAIEPTNIPQIKQVTSKNYGEVEVAALATPKAGGVGKEGIINLAVAPELAVESEYPSDDPSKTITYESPERQINSENQVYYLYPDKVTADKYCREKGHPYSESYTTAGGGGGYAKYDSENKIWELIGWGNRIGNLICVQSATVCLNTAITATFNQLINKTTLNKDTIKIYKENDSDWVELGSAKISSFDASSGGDGYNKTTVNINIGLLESGGFYKVNILGENNGVKSKYGTTMVSDFEWTFGVASNGQICLLDKVKITGMREGGQFIKKDETDTLTLTTYDKNNNEIVETSNYNWEVKWESSIDDVVSVLNCSEQDQTDCEEKYDSCQWVNGECSNISEDKINILAKNKNGESTIEVTVTTNNQEIKTNQADYSVFLCENIWNYNEIDISGGEGNEYNFELKYCVGNGEDLLPELQSPVSVGIGTDVPDLKKEMFFSVGNGDIIGLKIFENLERLTPQSWYNVNTPNPGSPGSFYVDGYYALQEGRSVYVGAVKGPIGKESLNITPYIFLISYNDNASAETINIFKQLLSNWKFNIDLTLEDKEKIQRDLLRIYDLDEIRNELEGYKNSDDNNFYPILNSGTFIYGQTNSLWPSWQNVLSKALGWSAPVDPINKFNSDCLNCDSAPDEKQCQATCYNSLTKEFNCPSGSRIYQYYTPKRDGCVGHYYTLKMNFEYPGVTWLGTNDNIGVGTQETSNDCYNYSYSPDSAPVCGNSQLDCGEVCDGILNKNGENFPANTVCNDNCNGYSCESNYADCDVNINNTGCEININTDVDNCGVCNNLCSRYNKANVADYECIAGVCAIESCQTNYSDCNNSFADGCEADVSSINTCGSCGIKCSHSGANVAISCSLTGVDYVCQYECSGGYGDCNEDMADPAQGDGCETSILTKENCGGCGISCGACKECDVEVAQCAPVTDNLDPYNECNDSGCGTGFCKSGACGYYTSGQQKCAICYGCNSGGQCAAQTVRGSAAINFGCSSEITYSFSLPKKQMTASSQVYLFPNNATAEKYCQENGYSTFSSYTNTGGGGGYAAYSNTVEAWALSGSGQYVGSLICTSLADEACLYCQSGVCSYYRTFDERSCGVCKQCNDSGKCNPPTAIVEGETARNYWGHTGGDLGCIYCDTSGNAKTYIDSQRHSCSICKFCALDGTCQYTTAYYPDSYNVYGCTGGDDKECGYCSLSLGCTYYTSGHGSCALGEKCSSSGDCFALSGVQEGANAIEVGCSLSSETTYSSPKKQITVTSQIYLFPNNATAEKYCQENGYSTFKSYTNINSGGGYAAYSNGAWALSGSGQYIGSLICTSLADEACLYYNPSSGCGFYNDNQQHGCGECKICSSGKCDNVSNTTVCGTHQLCQNGSCGQTCVNGWGDCDAAVAGCETDLNITSNHCGTCATTCDNNSCLTGICSEGGCVKKANNTDCGDCKECNSAGTCVSVGECTFNAYRVYNKVGLNNDRCQKCVEDTDGCVWKNISSARPTCVKTDYDYYGCGPGIRGAICVPATKTTPGRVWKNISRTTPAQKSYCDQGTYCCKSTVQFEVNHCAGEPR